MNVFKLMLPVVGGLVLLITNPAAGFNQEKPTPAQQFLITVAQMDQAEIQMAELAKNRAKNPKVKEFAERMSRDHDKNRKALLEHFKNLKTAVVAALKEEDKKTYDRLADLEGDAFDREYMKVQVERHKEAIKMFQTHAKSEDAQVKQWSQKQLKDLQDHLKHAQKVQKSLQGNDARDQKELKDQNR